MNLCYVLIYFGSIQRPPGISLEVAGVSRDHFGGILWWSDFSRKHKIMKHLILHVSCDSLRRKSEESMRNRCPVIFQPSIDIKKSRYAAPTAVILANDTRSFILGGKTIFRAHVITTSHTTLALMCKWIPNWYHIYTKSNPNLAQTVSESIHICNITAAGAAYGEFLI